LPSAINKVKKKPISIYMHIPFCTKKCFYCDFVSFPISAAYDVASYIEALIKEIELNREILASYVVETIFIGGGTPSSIDGKYITALLRALNTYAEISKDAEITIEANPGTLTQEKINHYLNSGINRVSMGLQSSDQTLLKTIGRHQNLDDFLTSYDALLKNGITNINMDIMFGLPGQTMASLEQTLQCIADVKPKHVSAYALKLEEGTPLYDAYQKGLITLPDEDEERAMYHRIQSFLAEIGCLQYELSNFAVPGFESKHNLVYWENKPYLGLGIAAHSKVDYVRFENPVTLDQYTQKLTQNILPKFNEEKIDSEEDLFETIMLGLRLNKGINIFKINTDYHIDFKKKYKKALETLLKDKLIYPISEEGVLILTPLGQDVSNRVFLAFMDA